MTSQIGLNIFLCENGVKSVIFKEMGNFGDWAFKIFSLVKV